MDKNHDFTTPEGIDKFLAEIDTELKFENEMKRHWAFFLGRDMKNLILHGTLPEKDHKILSEIAFSDAMIIVCGEPYEERTFKTMDQKIAFDSLRNAFVGAVDRLKKFHTNEKVGEILSAAASLFMESVCQDGTSVLCLEFVGFTLSELVGQHEPIV